MDIVYSIMGKINISLGIGIVVLIVLSISGVSSYGIVADNSANNPLYMKQGEVLDYEFRLQNVDPSDEGNNIIVGAEYSGDEIATITDSVLEYPIPFGRKDVKVHFRIEIPENAEDGDTYQFGAKFMEIKEQGEGMLTMNVDVLKITGIIIGEEPVPEVVLAPEEKKELNGSLIFLVVVVFIVVIAIFFSWVKKRRVIGSESVI